MQVIKRLISILGVGMAFFLTSTPALASPVVTNHGSLVCGSATTCPSTSFNAKTGDSLFVVCDAGSTAVFNLATDSGSNTYTLDKNGTHRTAKRTATTFRT